MKQKEDEKRRGRDVYTDFCILTTWAHQLWRCHLTSSRLTWISHFCQLAPFKAVLWEYNIPMLLTKTIVFQVRFAFWFWYSSPSSFLLVLILTCPIPYTSQPMELTMNYFYTVKWALRRTKSRIVGIVLNFSHKLPGKKEDVICNVEPSVFITPVFMKSSCLMHHQISSSWVVGECVAEKVMQTWC